MFWVTSPHIILKAIFLVIFYPKGHHYKQHELTGKSLMNRSYVIMNYTSRRLSDTFKQYTTWRPVNTVERSQHLKVESNTFDQRKYTVCVHVSESDRERLELNFWEPHFQFVFLLILLRFLICPLQKPDTLLAFYPSICQKWPFSVEESVESKTFWLVLYCCWRTMWPTKRL